VNGPFYFEVYPLSGRCGIFILDRSSCFFRQLRRNFCKSMILGRVFRCFLHHFFRSCAASYEITINTDIPARQDL